MEGSIRSPHELRQLSAGCDAQFGKCIVDMGLDHVRGEVPLLRDSAVGRAYGRRPDAVHFATAAAMYSGSSGCGTRTSAVVQSAGNASVLIGNLSVRIGVEECPDRRHGQAQYLLDIGVRDVGHFQRALRKVSRVCELCSGLVDLVVGVGHHRCSRHRFALPGQRFVVL